MRASLLFVFVWAGLQLPQLVRADVEQSAEVEPEICLRSPVVLQRKHLDDRIEVSLTTCEGEPNLAVLDEVSALARPRRMPRPTREAIERYRREHPDHTSWVAPGARRLHPGLLTRLQALADRWPDRAFVINSGYRPNARRGSRHRTGRALDFAIEGVHRREVAEFARSFEATGVGYYPNSTFTHVDVREQSAHWADLSGPGERPRYVAWPSEEEDAERVAEARVASETRVTQSEVLRRVEAALAQLEASPFGPHAPAPDANGDDDDGEGDEDEVADTATERAIRDDALAQIERALEVELQYTQIWFATPVDWSPPFDPEP